MGWYSGNPSDLDNLPPVKVAKKYVEYMGGDIAAIITRVEGDIATANAADLSTYKKAQAANETYRWAAEVLKHVVFATHIPDDPTCTTSCSPDPTEAELLLADVYEQLGYQAESGPWRAVYLQAALELRDPAKVGGPALATASDDISTNMTLSMLFDYLAIQLDPQKLKSNVEAQQPSTPFEDVVLNVRVNVTGDNDSVEGTIGTYLVTVRNSVFNYTEIDALDSLDSTPLGNVSIQLTRDVLDNILIGAINAEVCTPPSLDDCISVISGNPEVLNVIQSSLTSPEFWFRIVTPRPDTPTQ
jgi:alkyl sulfatase BDS1-like metallo-beta-lactamase superfamily hydrolase